MWTYCVLNCNLCIFMYTNYHYCISTNSLNTTIVTGASGGTVLLSVSHSHCRRYSLLTLVSVSLSPSLFNGKIANHFMYLKLVFDITVVYWDAIYILLSNHSQQFWLNLKLLFLPSLCGPQKQSTNLTKWPTLKVWIDLSSDSSWKSSLRVPSTSIV